MTLLPLGKPRAVETFSLNAEVDVDDLSVFVTEWQGRYREWSKLIHNEILR